MKFNEIPKWAIACTWILIIALFCLLVYFIIYLNKNIYELRLIGDACSICQQQKYEAVINLSNLKISPTN